MGPAQFSEAGSGRMSRGRVPLLQLEQCFLRCSLGLRPAAHSECLELDSALRCKWPLPTPELGWASQGLEQGEEALPTAGMANTIHLAQSTVETSENGRNRY